MTDQAIRFSEKQLPIDTHGVTVQRMKQTAALRTLYYTVVGQGHTVLAGTPKAVRPRDNRGKFLPGWTITLLAVREGQRYGLGVERDYPKPMWDTTQVYAYSVEVLDRQSLWGPNGKT